MTATLIRPSTILPEGICIRKVNDLMLFKFTDQLGNRMQELLDKKKADTLAPDEFIELETIGELDRVNEKKRGNEIGDYWYQKLCHL